MTVNVNITAKLLVEGDTSEGHSALLVLIKDIDQRIADWAFTLALADFFDKLRADHAKEVEHDKVPDPYADLEDQDEADELRRVHP